MLKALLNVASIVNCAGGAVLIATWVGMSQRVPIIVLFIGLSLLIQGVYTLLYLRGSFDRWGEIATGAFFAGEGLAGFVGLGGVIAGVIHNIQNADMEMAPVLAGLLMATHALLALFYLLANHKLRPAKS
ncbi:MAG TPA: hypothetical protein VFP26_00115 [Gemmatimonadaceae bacterium]|nr:hypothetical protein [Gemmatimonadaceae bacterium]